MSSSCLFAVCFLGLQIVPLAAQNTAPPQPDTLILSDNEKLIGHLVRATGASVVFKSDVLGTVTVDWAKVKELHTAGSYAVVQKGVKLKHKESASAVPRGRLDVAGETITVQSAGGRATPDKVPVADAGHVVDLPTFENKMLHNPGIFEEWAGGITGGATYVNATQESRSITGTVHLVRAVPGEGWLPPSDRTIVNFSITDGFTQEPNIPRVKIAIVHGDVERDKYLNSSHIFLFGQGIFDHNYSQGLNLQQNYGGGVGWTVIQNPNTTLDVKGSASYINQNFRDGGLGHNLIASPFAENLLRKLPHGMIVLQQLSFTPAWNETRAWLGTAGVSFSAPVYERLSFSIGFQDSRLNDPPPTFKKNSFQATTGLTYTLR